MKKKIPNLKFKESLRPLIDDCSYQISEEVLRQLVETEFDLSLYAWGDTSLGLQGDDFGAPIGNWPNIALHNLKESIDNGCMDGDGIEDFKKTLRTLKEYIGIIEKEISKRTDKSQKPTT